MRAYKQLNADGTLNHIGKTDAKTLTLGEFITNEEYEKLSKEIKEKVERDEAAIKGFVEKVKTGEKKLEEVPEEYRDIVENIINPKTEQPNQDFQIGYEQALLDLAEVQ